jgi:hypothetical protein
MKTKNRLIKNKRGYSMAMTLIYGLVSLFGIGILYIVFNQVFTAHLLPTMVEQVNTSNIDAATKAEIFVAYNKWMIFFNLLPFILFFTVVIYMLLSSWRREQQDL